ncbi:MAG: hypothetical protein J6V89_03145 [Acetobacter sp.]|nr:hypothetical protein [Acetobacter sp.]
MSCFAIFPHLGQRFSPAVAETTVLTTVDPTDTGLICLTASTTSNAFLLIQTSPLER